MNAIPETAASVIKDDGRPIVGGARERGTSNYVLTDPYRGTFITEVSVPGRELIDRAVHTAMEGQHAVTAMPTHLRASSLRLAAVECLHRQDELATTICRQTGKAMRDCWREIERGAFTLRAAATALENMSTALPLPDATPGGEGLIAYARREPLGVIAAITPFNAPFNLVLHKVAAALAVGNSVVIKPALQAPLSALQVAELLTSCGFPPAALSVLPGGPEIGRELAAHDGIDAISLTGGVAAAREIALAAPLKRHLFELGGNSPNIVHSDADLKWATKALVAGAFSNTGQSCNSVQRIIVHRSAEAELLEHLVNGVRRLRVGDPLDRDVDIGTLVDERAAQRVEAWVTEATTEGASVLIGGKRSGAAFDPTILAGVTSGMKVATDELFGPVATVMVYDQLDEAIAIANETIYGLQAAVFTRSMEVAFRAVDNLHVGTVLVNRSTNFRLDHFPFGGVKSSGDTREGGRFSLEDMTTLRTVILDPAATGLPHPLAR